ncbi:lipopolysaccharide biosynthesis protein [Dictyobacter kobayashii]|uniref:Uncharacterized protein n=1 Tax=Dictyobacter kobayashii TaxID=2014872 RepID=A0A402APB6_9CHLR|nr:oligosaccharide flippase family protein [Dictyobacter kobayashii]GCE20957.1 hypothetical protein KDK_47570 [Dictyobacter kobayashii]
MESSLPIPAAVEKKNEYLLQLRSLLKSSGIYALASLASPLIALVMSPFLTHTLSHDDYGALAVLTTVIALAAGISQLGMGSAFFRTYSYDYESPQDKLKVLSTTVTILLLTALPLTILMFLCAPWLSQLLFETTLYADPIRYAAVVILLQNMSIPGYSWLRAENKALAYSILSIAYLLLNLLATVILVGPLHAGISGALLASGLGYALVVLLTIPVIIFRSGLLLYPRMAGNLLSFGLPLVSNFVSVWILQLSDRYLLSHFGSLSETASYSVAYTLGGVVSVVILSPFSLAWPTTMYSIAKKPAARETFQVIFHWFSIVLLLAAFGLSLLSTLLLTFFFPTAYHAAALVIPIISASLMFYGLYTIFNIGVSLKRKTWYAALFTCSAAILNVVLNLVLIPRYGAMGRGLDATGLCL